LLETLSLAALVDFSGILQLKKAPNGPVRLPGNSYLVIGNMGVTCANVNKNEEQPKSFTGRIFKE